MKLTFEKYSNQKELWENINKEAINSTFLTSIHWIEFQKTLGKEFDQYFIVLNLEGKKIEIGILYFEIFRRKLQKYAYAPYQPVLIGNELNEQEFQDVYSQIQRFMQDYVFDHKLTLFRFDPLLPSESLQNLKNLGFKASLAPAQAKDVWEKNLEKSEDELRSEMSDSTRHNVNKGSKSGIELIKAETQQDVKAFATLMSETTKRKGFGNYNYEYFRKQFEELNPKNMMDIFLAKYQGRYLSGALINYYKDTAYYTHGASTSDRSLSKLRSPYFLQWEIMKYVKSQGYQKYNMWGIIPDSKRVEVKTQFIEEEQTKLQKILKILPWNRPKKPNPLQGVSDFKKSFGGYEINYVGPVETYNEFGKYLLHKALDWFVYRKDRY